MPLHDVALASAAACSGLLWTAGLAWRAGQRRPSVVIRAALGGVAALSLALLAYDLLALAGQPVRWDPSRAGGAEAARVGAVIGLVEEAAKLAGVLLAVEGLTRRRHALAMAMGVGAVFGALEVALTLRGAGLGPAVLARAAFAPVAHALLAVPLGVGVALLCRGAPRRWALPLALLAAAFLHGAADASLLVPAVGGPGFAAALLVPALALFVVARRGVRRPIAQPSS